MAEDNAYTVDLDKVYAEYVNWEKFAKARVLDQAEPLAYRLVDKYFSDLLSEVRNTRVTLDEDKLYTARQDAKYDRLAARYTRELDAKDAEINDLKQIAKVNYGLYKSANEEIDTKDAEIERLTGILKDRNVWIADYESRLKAFADENHFDVKNASGW